MSTKPVMIRLTDEEIDTLKSRAGILPVSTYIKTVLFNGDSSAIHHSDLEKEWIEFGKLCDIDKVFDILSMKTHKRPSSVGYMNHWVVYFLTLLTGAPKDNSDPSAWSIVPNPDGELRPWTNEDNQKILVITDGKNNKTLTEDDEWFKFFV